MDRRKAFGRRLRELRQCQGYSQERLAEVAGLHRTYVGDVERGERNISLDKIWRLADALGVSPTAFFQDVDPRQPHSESFPENEETTPFGGDRFPSRSPQGAGVRESDSWQATRAQVAKRLTGSVKVKPLNCRKKWRQCQFFESGPFARFQVKLLPLFGKLPNTKRTSGVWILGVASAFWLILGGIGKHFLWDRNQHGSTKCPQCSWLLISYTSVFFQPSKIAITTFT